MDADLGIEEAKADLERQKLQQGADRLVFDRTKEAGDWMTAASEAARTDPAGFASLLPGARVRSIDVAQGEAAPHLQSMQLQQPPNATLQAPMQGQPQQQPSLGAEQLRAPQADAMVAFEPPQEEMQRARDRVFFKLGKPYGNLAGTELGNIDTRAIADERYQQALLAGKGAEGFARNQSELAQIRAATAQAAEQAAAGQKAPDAMKDAMVTGRFQIGQMGMDRRQAVASEQAGARTDFQQIRLVDHLRNRHVTNVSQKFNIGKQNESIAATNAMLNQLALDNPLTDRVAFTKTLKAMFSSVTSNTELTYAQEAGGMENRIAAELNRWFNEGRIPDDYKAWLVAASKQSLIEAQEIKIKAAEAVRYGVQNDSTIARATSNPDWQQDLGEEAAQMILSSAGDPSADAAGGPADLPAPGGESLGVHATPPVRDPAGDGYDDDDGDGLPDIDGVIYE